MEYKFNECCEILQLNTPFSNSELRKQYRLLALKYHPDKYDKDDNGEKFKEIHSAYVFLNKHLNKKDIGNKSPESYTDLLEDFFKYLNVPYDLSIVVSVIETLHGNYDMLAKNLFNSMSKDSSLELFYILHKYKDVLNVPTTFFNELEKIVREKYEKDNLVILYPSIEDLFNSNIFCLDYKDELYYVPMWHSELTYKINNSDLIVKCIPNLPDNISIDEHNNIHVYLNIHFATLLDLPKIEFYIGNKNFSIQTSKLCVLKNQTIKLSNLGIPIINFNDLYDNKSLSHIYVHIHFIK